VLAEFPDHQLPLRSLKQLFLAGQFLLFFSFSKHISGLLY
jgi:hypothetical protein